MKSKHPPRHQRFLNREWSWLRFNERVLEEAENPDNPLLERVKFLSIFANNLDEFFMVRVAGLYRQLEVGIEASGTDKRSPRDQLDGISRIAHELWPRHERALEGLLTALANEGIHVLRADQPDEQGRAYLERYYEEVVYPVITPMIVGPTHPFPMLQNLTLYLVLRLAKKKKKEQLAFVGLPKVLPRFIQVPCQDQRVQLVPLESLLVLQLPKLFAGYEIYSLNAARVTRDADIRIDEEAAEDFRKALAKKLLGRRHGAAVRLEHGSRMDAAMHGRLQARLEVDEAQHYPRRTLMQSCDLTQLCGLVDRPDLTFAPMEPLPAWSVPPRDIYRWIRRRPRLLYHPYHSFDPVTELVATAAEDPAVLAIKQTLYRTSGDSSIIQALTRAAELGKHVTVVVELRARFDEERNIQWARRLEQAGAHVVYGLVGYKTHCKALLVVRREEDGIRRYMHFGTGNYNDATARLYTDMGLMLCDELYGEDASALFNIITGATVPPAWNKVEMSPVGIRRRLLQLIDREGQRSTKARPGRIMAKMNSLQDKGIIDALYRASAAGVRVDLIVRGICCLRAGVPKLSENIRVCSVVGRFLEHPRIFWFRNDGKHDLYISSADWMPRNLDHRVELMIPVEQPEHRKYIKAMLELQLKDNVKARDLQPDGKYHRVTRGKRRIDSQVAIHDLTRKTLAKAVPPQGQVRLVPLGRAQVLCED